MAQNPVKSLLSDPQGDKIGTELADKVRMRQEADKALKPSSPAPAPTPVKPISPMRVDKIKHSDPAGTVRGVKDIDTKDMTKPLGSFKKGGEVPQTGMYKMHAGEHVLSTDNKGKLQHALGLASDALSHGEPDEDDMPETPAKRVKEMHMRKGANGGFIIKHTHEMPHDMPMHDEEHVQGDMKGLHDHLDSMWGEQK